MSEATPGPWTYDQIASVIWGDDEDSRQGFPIARMPTSRNSPRDAAANRANGRLICAAPELLAALKNLANAAKGGMQPAGAMITALKEADAAIASAEGGGTIICECRDWCRDGRDMVSLHHPRCSKYTPPPDDPRFASFGKSVWKYITDQGRDFCGNEISEDVMPLAEAVGLCRQVEYLPSLHGDMEAELGDLVWWWGDNAKAEGGTEP